MHLFKSFKLHQYSTPDLENSMKLFEIQCWLHVSSICELVMTQFDDVMNASFLYGQTMSMG